MTEKPDLVLVYGDTNTTVAGALAAAKLKIPVVHVEAGIRQQPMDMPEEINRVLTDHISSQLFCCSALASENLKNEGITEGVSIPGDVMYDLYLMMQPRFTPDETGTRFGLEKGGYIIRTPGLPRPHVPHPALRRYGTYYSSNKWKREICSL